MRPGSSFAALMVAGVAVHAQNERHSLFRPGPRVFDEESRGRGRREGILGRKVTS